MIIFNHEQFRLQYESEKDRRLSAHERQVKVMFGKRERGKEMDGESVGG